MINDFDGWPNSLQIESEMSQNLAEEIEDLFLNMTKVFKMNRLQYSFASYILNVFVSVGMSNKCAKLFKALNTAQNGRLSKTEFK